MVHTTVIQSHQKAKTKEENDMSTRYGLQEKLRKEKEKSAAIAAANENKVLKQENETLKKENADLQKRNAEMKKRNAELEKQLKEASKNGTGGNDNSSGTGASEAPKNK